MWPCVCVIWKNTLRNSVFDLFLQTICAYIVKFFSIFHAKHGIRICIHLNNKKKTVRTDENIMLDLIK